MAVKRFRSRLCEPGLRLSLREELRVYLRQAPQLNTSQADALAEGDVQCLNLLTLSQQQFVLDCLEILSL
jgi:hypothetical protein